MVALADDGFFVHIAARPAHGSALPAQRLRYSDFPQREFTLSSLVRMVQWRR